MEASHKIPNSVEVLILGGGVHGVGVLHDLVSRGLCDNVCLIEKNKLASGTSSKSTKLIHGGLRYLQRLSQMPMVFESLQERKFLLSVAPDLVKPIEILIPLLKGDFLNWIKIKAGLSLYDYLARNSLIKNHKKLKMREVNETISLLKEQYTKNVFSYWDAQTDDQLLVRRVASSAQKLGGKFFEETEILQLKDKKDYWSVVVSREGKQTEIKAKYVINCLGPWTNSFFAKNKIKQTHKGINNKGTHLLVKEFGLKSGLLLTAKSDKRKFFILPWNGKTLIGTTEKEYSGSVNKVEPDSGEIHYLLSSCNEYLKKDLTINHIESSFSGLRWLATENDQSISGTSRESVLGVIKNRSGFLLTIYGGKLTSYRRLSEKVGDRVMNHKKDFVKSRTKDKSLWVSKDEARD